MSAANAPGPKTPRKTGKTGPTQRRGRLETRRLLHAKRDNDPRLALAVAYLGSLSRDKQADAELLTKLLESPADTPDAEGRTSNRRPTLSPKLTEAIVAALVANGTPLARQTLERLVAENLRAGATPATATAAVKAILTHPCPENEDLLFRIVTASDPPPADEFADTDLPRSPAQPSR